MCFRRWIIPEILSDHEKHSLSVLSFISHSSAVCVQSVSGVDQLTSAVTRSEVWSVCSVEMRISGSRSADTSERAWPTPVTWFTHLSMWDYRRSAVKMTSYMLSGQAFDWTKHGTHFWMKDDGLFSQNVKLETLYSKVQFVSSVASWLECEFVWEPNQSNGSVRQSASQSERHTCCWLNSAPWSLSASQMSFCFGRLRGIFRPCERLWGVRVWTASS